MSASTDWSDPNQCPFCGDVLASPGNGFIDHVDENENCADRFDTWRGRISDDMHAGWSG